MKNGIIIAYKSIFPIIQSTEDYFSTCIYIYSFYVWKTVQLRNPHAKFLLQQSWKDTLFILILPIAIFILITTTLFHLLESPRTWRKKEGKRNYYNSSMEYSKYSPFPRCSPDLSLTLLKRELRNSPVEDIKYSLFLRKQHRVVASFRKNDHPQGHPPLIIIFSRAQYGGRGISSWTRVRFLFNDQFSVESLFRE